MLKILRLIAWCCCLVSLVYPVRPDSAWAGQATRVVRIGVLSFQDPAITLAQWQPTARELSRLLPKITFTIRALSYEQLDAAVATDQVDFVLTNPEHYVVLRNSHGLRPVATLNQSINGQVVDRFGSVIFTRASSTIHSLDDVRGKRVAAVGLQSLGGYLMAADTFKNRQIDLQDASSIRLSFLGVPHSKVVQAVLNDQADAGIVRTGVLEQMAARKQLDLSQVRILERAPADRFPQLLSTDLYPEWPWAAMPHMPSDLTKAVAIALLQIQPTSAAAIAGAYQGFSTPANYTEVEDLMRRLQLYPGQPPVPLWEIFWDRYEQPIELALLTLMCVGVAASIWLWRGNRHLRTLNMDAQTGLELEAAASHSQVGLIVTDLDTRIKRVNPAMASMLGFAPDDLIGQSTDLLRGHDLPDGTIQKVWQEVRALGYWRGELRCHHCAGYDVPCMVTISTIGKNDAGLTGFVGSFTDISVQKKAESEIRELAYFDHLTQLPNRRMFLECLQTTMAAALTSGTLAGIMFIDLDHFKNLNDTHGHSVGDQLLRLIAQRLSLLIGPSDTAARLGGDEFVVMTPGLDADPEIAMTQTMAVAERIHQALLCPFELDTQGDLSDSVQSLCYTCSGSIGVALFGAVSEPLTEVLKRADVAMYLSKQDGRNLIRRYDPVAQQKLNDRVALSNDLNSALQDGQLHLLYQLQVDSNNEAVGAECLLRWQHPQRGLVSPAEFIPLAEDSGAIVAMGDWVVRCACDTLVRWASTRHLRHVSLSVNVSPRQFNEPDFVERVAGILQATGAKARLLRLEVTEGIVMQNTQEVIAKMNELCALGLSFSIDDFGTGYSSLSYLQMLPLAEVKIDKTFVNDLTTSRRSEAIIKAIIALGHSMDIVIVSEGVETSAQKDRLMALGCTLLQGYLITRPVTCAELETLIADHHTPSTVTLLLE